MLRTPTRGATRVYTFSAVFSVRCEGPVTMRAINALGFSTAQTFCPSIAASGGNP